MRILIATAHRNLVGGVEKYLQAVIPALRARSHEVGLLYEYPAIAEREKIDSLEEVSRAWCLAEGNATSALASIADWNPDVVYYHGFDRTESMAIEDALLSAYPMTLYVHNYDRTCGTGQKCFMFPQPQACTRQIGPMCLLLHYPRRCGGLHPGVMWRRYRRHAALNARLGSYQAVLVASSHMRRELAGSRIASDRVHLLPLPAADMVVQSHPPEPRRLTGEILFVGRLTNLKGVDYLIRAIPLAERKLNRGLTVAIAGDGPARKSIQGLACELGVQVEFRGWLQTSDKLSLMRQAELLAVPSLWPEPFGLVGCEAGAVGLPAVGFATGGIPDWLVPGETGELAPSGPPTPNGLSDAIVRALASPQHYARLCQGAWRLAARFTLSAHVDSLETWLFSIARSGRAEAVPYQHLAVKDTIPQ